MLRRSLIRSMPAVVGASLVTGTSLTMPRLVQAADAGKEHDYDRYGFTLYPVYGDATIIIKIPYKKKIVLKKRFEAKIEVKEFKCKDKGLLLIKKGFISAKFKDDDKYRHDDEGDKHFDLSLDYEPFYAYADIFKDHEDEDDDYWRYKPDHDDDHDDHKKKLIIDIGKIIIIKKIKVYGKEVVIVYVLNPDDFKIDPKKFDPKVFKKLKECADRKHDEHDDKDDEYDDKKA